MNQQPTRLRSAITGVLGFWLGGLLGNFATYLIAISGFLGWVLGFIPQEQSIVRLLFAILLVFAIVGIGGVVTGVFNGLALQRIDRGGNRRRLLFGAGYAYGVGHGTLIVPILLLISLIALYNNGHRAQPQAYLMLFGVLGLVYGLLIGLIFSLLTINFKRMWGVLLAVVAGYTLGGVLLGLLLWRADLVSSGIVPLRVILRLLLVSLLIDLPVGIFVGLAFHSLAQKRERLDEAALQPGRIQRFIVIGVSLVGLFLVLGVIRNADTFLTINPAATATQISSETVGVHWTPPASVPDGSPVVARATTGALATPEALTPPDISASATRLGLAWSAGQGEASDVFYSFQETDAAKNTAWSEPVNVSNSPAVESSHPQLVMDSTGTSHLVWEEVDPQTGASQILYSHCEEGSCTPPVSLSAGAGPECAAGLREGNNQWPSVAVDAADHLLAAWSAGAGSLFYNTWSAGELPPTGPAGCITTAGAAAGSKLQPRLAGGSAGAFALAYTSGGVDRAGEILVQRFENGAWSQAGTPLGAGFSPALRLDTADQLQIAWCDAAGALNYQLNESPSEQIASPACLGRPVLGQGQDGLPHLVWFSDEVENVNGVTSPADLLYESLRTGSGWSPAAIVAQTSAAAQPALASQAGGALHLAWSDTKDNAATLNYARQDPYQCETDSLNELGQVALNTIQGGGFHPADYQVPYCDNQFVDFVYQPNPSPAFSSDPPTENGGFDRVAQALQNAQYEVLFVNMQWDADQNDESPGFTYTKEIANLYQMVKADPAKYPRGMLVRILLGNYPEMTTLQWGDQIWNVMQDLREAGLEEMENPELGWKVEVANFAGTWPHSHTKFVVIDGKLLIGAGFNYSWLHYPKNHPSGRGDGLTDLGMIVLGPAAQPALSDFDEMWEGANQLSCPDYASPDETAWSQTCQWQKAVAWHVPEVLKYYPAGSQHNAFALFRTAYFKEADHTYDSVLGAAHSSIDAIHVNFSLELICMMNILVPDACTYDNSLSWMQAMMDAVDQNHVRVRIIVENANSNGLENRVAIKVFQDELAKRGLSDYVEIRFFNGRLHMKSALIDQQLLLVGSQNFHYSSFGDKGLLEFVVASDDPTAIDTYQQMFEYYWEQAIPLQDADWANVN